MKVLHFYKTYLPDTIGGVEKVINEIALGTAKLGINVEVMALSANLVDREVQVNSPQFIAAAPISK